MNAIEFEMDIVPIFNKLEVNKDESFHVVSLDNKEEFDNMYFIIYHGVLYNLLLKLENKDILEYNEFQNLVDTYFSFSLHEGIKTVFYGEQSVMTVSPYDEDKGVFITPVFNSDIKKRNV